MTNSTNQTRQSALKKSTKNLLAYIVDASKRLKHAGPMERPTAKPVLTAIQQLAGLDAKEEAMLFAVIFHRHANGSSTNLSDVADFLECSFVDVLFFTPYLQSLLSRGFLTHSNTTERDIKDKEFFINSDIYNDIIEGKDIRPVTQSSASAIDQFTFCDMVHDVLEDRKAEEISTRRAFASIEQLEEENSTLQLVQTMKESFSDVDSRVLFYEMCRDFSSDYRGNNTLLCTTLSGIYDKVMDGARVRNSLINESHPLVKEDFIQVGASDEGDIPLSLTEKGIRLLFGDCADGYVNMYKCKNGNEFLSKLDDIFHMFFLHSSQNDFRNNFKSFQKLEKSNQHIPAVADTMKVVSDANDRLVYYKMCKKLADADLFNIRHLDELYPSYRVMDIKRDIKENQHSLQKLGLIEIEGGNFFDQVNLVLTNKGKELFFKEDLCLIDEKVCDKDLVDCATIAEKQLFFDPALDKQLSMLKDSLYESKLTSIRERLKTNNLPTGVAALLYGEPGTGKTESVLQIARATGRAIMHVDISQTKSCWLGESEKLIKGVFDRYRKLCATSKLKPILLFNEADGVLSKRKDVRYGNVTHTENAMQNIILEEMENLDGILIATTNLASNLDGAFQRRFLFKVRFNKPTIESKKNIWKNKMSHLSDEEALDLATKFDFSGGEIDNIVRKATMEEVLNGETPSIERLKTLCLEERISTSTPRKKIGFC